QRYRGADQPQAGGTVMCDQGGRYALLAVQYDLDEFRLAHKIADSENEALVIDHDTAALPVALALRTAARIRPTGTAHLDDGKVADVDGALRRRRGCYRHEVAGPVLAGLGPSRRAERHQRRHEAAQAAGHAQKGPAPAFRCFHSQRPHDAHSHAAAASHAPMIATAMPGAEKIGTAG